MEAVSTAVGLWLMVVIGATPVPSNNLEFQLEIINGFKTEEACQSNLEEQIRNMASQTLFAQGVCVHKNLGFRAEPKWTPPLLERPEEQE